jgi:beta-lactamase superfamily II metal-dependent hydrolase
MTATIEFFPVGSGDMTLVRLASGKTILIDINIRGNADKENEKDFPDVAAMLKNRLDRQNGIPFIDVFMLSHPDQDHISGLQNHFHLGAPSLAEEADNEKDQKILIREMWSSPLTFRRAKKEDTTTPNAEAWKEEAKRRVKMFKNKEQGADEDGNLIRVLGDDIEHKTDGIERLLVKTGDVFNEICREFDDTFSALLLAPKFVTDAEEADALAGKNNTSIVIQISLASKSGEPLETKFLTGGDAEVDIWKRIWNRNKDQPEKLGYHILQTPHHCSLGSLSSDSYNDRGDQKGKGEQCVIDEEAHKALSQAENKALIIASMDEPERESGRGLARRKYTDIAEGQDGKMRVTMVDCKDKPLKITITGSGPDLSGAKTARAVPPKVEKANPEGGYA